MIFLIHIVFSIVSYYNLWWTNGIHIAAVGDLQRPYNISDELGEWEWYIRKQPNKLWLAVVGSDSNIPVLLSFKWTFQQVFTCGAWFVCAIDSCHCWTPLLLVTLAWATLLSIDLSCLPFCHPHSLLFPILSDVWWKSSAVYCCRIYFYCFCGHLSHFVSRSCHAFFLATYSFPFMLNHQIFSALLFPLLFCNVPARFQTV